MDDFNLSTLYESRNEYCSLLLSKLSPLIIQGIRSIFDEAVRLCRDNEEDEKYLMTFQNFLARVPKWNTDIVLTEADRIKRVSACAYLEELITCVHITQLKVLTSIRVGRQQKKIDISIPKLPEFIHRVYIESARRIYKNVYLFDVDVPPLTRQKNARECEMIVNECIMSVIRESMPIETILRSYMDPTTEEEVFEEREEIVEREPIVPTQAAAAAAASASGEEQSGTTAVPSANITEEAGEFGIKKASSADDGDGLMIAKRDDSNNKDDTSGREENGDVTRLDDIPTVRIERNPDTGVREIVRKVDTGDTEQGGGAAMRQIQAPSSFEAEITRQQTMIGLEELNKIDIDTDEKIRVEGSIGGSDSIQLDFDTL